MKTMILGIDAVLRIVGRTRAKDPIASTLPTFHASLAAGATWLAAMLGFMHTAHAVNLYGTGFENPPFVAGVNTWAGTDGWQSSDSSAGIQGIISGQAAYLGFNPPPAANNFVWRLFNYNPLAQQTPIVDVGMDIAIVDSTNSQYDQFEVKIYNASGTTLGGVYLDNRNLRILRSDGVSYTDTGAKFVNNSTLRLMFSINYSSNTWSATLAATPLFTNVPFHAGSGALDFGDMTYAWYVTTAGSPGNNYLAVDNLSISASALPIIPPTLTAPTSTAINHNSATLGGNVTGNGGSALTERGVVYSITTTNGNPVIGGTGVTKVVASGTSTGVFSTPVTGLIPGTGYSFKAYATNSEGASYTATATAITSSLPADGILYSTGFDQPPFVAGVNTWAGTEGWQSADMSGGTQGITSNQAYLGFNAPSTASPFVWKQFNYDPIAQQKPVVDVGMDIAVMDSDNGNYDYFGIQIYNANGVFLGGIRLNNVDQHIWRSDGVTSVATGVAFVKNSTHRLTFSVNFSTNTWTASLSGTVLFTNAPFHGGSEALDFGDLTYYWQVATSGSPGNNFLLVDNLSISAKPLTTVPSVTAPTSAAITSTSATLGGNVTSDGGTSLTERGVVYSPTTTNNNPVIGGTGVIKVVASGTTTGVFTASVTGLSPSSGYSYKAYATNSVGTTYTSPVASFTTPATLPSVATATADAITPNSATLGGNVTSNGGGSLIERGIVCSVTTTNNNPVIGGTGVINVVASGTTTGIFSAPVTALTPNTGYSFKAYAINSAGTGYTSVGTFTTSPAPTAGDLDAMDLSLASPMGAMAVQPDGKFIIAGPFTSVLGVPRRGIARLNADGTLDTGFDPNPNTTVSCVVVQADGKVLIGGFFTTLKPNGAATTVTRNRIARLHPDGTLDTGFDPNANNTVTSIAVQADGKVLLGGHFGTLRPNGAATTTSRNRIARVNSDGTLDTGFNPNANNTVTCLAVQPDGKVLLGGYFTALQPNGASSATSRNRIARLNPDGTLDTGYNPNANSSVFCLDLQSDGKALFGGVFTTLQPIGAPSGIQRRLIARVNVDGTLDDSFAPNPTGSGNTVSCIAVQVDGKVLLSGSFTSISAAERLYLARVNADGSLDAGFDPRPNGSASSIVLQVDGKVLIGGSFTTLQPNGAATAITRSRFARLINDSATQTLTVPDSSQITWARSGAGPELQSVTFERSTDGGVTWTSLGAGVRMAGGWRIDNLSLFGDGKVRALGRTGGGSSSGIIEQVAEFGFVSSFDAFVTGFGLNPQTTGAPDLDYDHDGIPNLMEFIVGGNPVVPDPNLNPVLSTTPVAGGRNLIFTYRRKLAAASIAQTVEHSATLTGIWTPAVHGQNGVIIATSPVDAQTEQVTVTIPSTSPKRFVRMKATR